MSTFSSLFKPPQRHGHKVFVENETNRISLADYSGYFPHQTDDGPLFVAPDAEVEIVLNRNRLFGIVPVTILWQDDSPSHVWTELPTLGALRGAMPALTFRASRDVQTLLDSIATLCAPADQERV